MTAPAQPPESPFKLNRTRFMILLLVALAAILIIGALSGGLEGYQQLRDGARQQQSGTGEQPTTPN